MSEEDEVWVKLTDILNALKNPEAALGSTIGDLTTLSQSIYTFDTISTPFRVGEVSLTGVAKTRFDDFSIGYCVTSPYFTGPVNTRVCPTCRHPIKSLGLGLESLDDD